MSAFRKFTRKELATFVRSMDVFIKEPTELLVIGERILRSQFRALVSRLFGPEAAKRVPTKRKPGAGGMRV